MSDSSEKLLVAKQDLMEALGDTAAQYLANMKLWFRYKWTKEEFDFETRKLLTPHQTYLHNKFLLAILNKIDAVTPALPLTPQPETTPLNTSGGSNSSKSRKRKRSSRNAYFERVVFEPYDLLDYIPSDNLECIRPAAGTDANVQILPTLRYCVQELFLPDAGFILGRFLIGAWEIGLVNVEDAIAEYVALSVQVFLKNLISAIVMKRKHYKVTGDGSYYYDVGAPLKDPSVRNTFTRQKIDDSPLELDKEITSPNFLRRPNEEGTFLSACEQIEPAGKYMITLRDVSIALKDRNLIPSHAVYSINMERIIQMMHK